MRVTFEKLAAKGDWRRAPWRRARCRQGARSELHYKPGRPRVRSRSASVDRTSIGPVRANARGTILGAPACTAPGGHVAASHVIMYVGWVASWIPECQDC